MSEDRMTLRYASVVPVFETGEERLMKFDLTGARKDGSNRDRGYYALRGKCYTPTRNVE
jgi:hypothetical protein